MSTFCDSLSVLFPEGERFFIDSVKVFRDQVEDPGLRAQVAGFIGQEAMHGREHRAFNDMLARQGFSVGPRAEARLRRILGWSRRLLSPHSQLAATCAFEHFTAMMAEALLRESDVVDVGNEMHSSVRPLWLWHALEEAEHKAVAFEVYIATGGSRLRRVLVMIPATLVFALMVSTTHVGFLAERGVLFRPWSWLRGLTYQWVWPGFLRRLMPAYLSYYRPNFHPDDRDTAALLERWCERLFGADDGELARYVQPGGPEAA